MQRNRFIVEAEGRPPLEFNERGAALLRIEEYRVNGVEAKLIDTEADSRYADGIMVSTPKPLRGW